MSVERIALLVAGAWVGLLVASSAVAIVNFRTVDRLLGPEMRPELARTLEAVPAEGRRFALRHVVSEVNRWIFRAGGAVQLALAVALVALLWRTGGAAFALAIVALAVTAVQAAGLAGAITSFGRSLDFVPRPLPPDLARRFGLLHGAYVLGDAAKAVLLVFLSVVLLRRPGA